MSDELAEAKQLIKTLQGQIENLQEDSYSETYSLVLDHHPQSNSAHAELN